MKMTFRWYGGNDPVSLNFIKQLPYVNGVVTALYNIPAGEVWDKESIAQVKSLCDSEAISFEVIESVPVTEAVKLGTAERDRHIQNYCKTIENLSEFGIKCICYNFMPVFDWLRTDLHAKNPDGSYSLAYFAEDMKKIDKKNLSLPGWDESYTKEELNGLLNAYETVTHEKLRENLFYFLDKIMPTCEKCDVSMAIHPDDPPWDIFGLPRIMSTERDFDILFSEVPSIKNGMTFCTGSLGAGRENNLVKMAAKYAAAGRIPFAHLRNILYEGEIDFRETAHLTSAGSLNIKGIADALKQNGFDGYVRPDHGRSIWGEEGKPGYGLFDRALGAAYLAAFFE